MKKYLNLFIISLCLFSLSGSCALAQNSLRVSPGDLFKQDKAEVKDQIKNIRDEKAKEIKAIKSEIDAKKQEAQTVMDSAKQKIADLKEKIKSEKDAAKAKLAEKRILGREEALGRFDTAIERVTELKNKINAVIAKHEANGLNVVQAKTFITEAEAKIAEAKAKTAEAYDLLGSSTNQLSPENKAKFQTLAKETQDLIIAARTELNDAVKSLKETIATKVESVKTGDLNPPLEDKTAAESAN